MYTVAIVAVALDVRDADILDAVATLAGPLGLRQICLVYVHPFDPMADPIMGGLVVETRTTAAPEGLTGLQAQLQARLPEVEVNHTQLTGRPHEQITRLAIERDADLVVIGRLKATGDRPAWGSRGQLIARHASRSVLLIPHEAKLRLDEVVVGMDFSRRAVESLMLGVQVGQRVRAVYAFHSDPGIAYVGMSPKEFSERIRRNAERHFERDVLAELPPGAQPPELEVLETERVSDGLLRAAATAGLVVVGSRGLTPLATMLLGSTAERVAGLSDAPVLIVRPKGEDVGLLRGLLERVGPDSSTA